MADTITKPLKLFCENNAAVFFSNNSKRSLACKLMDMKYLKVRYEEKWQLIVNILVHATWLLIPWQKLYQWKYSRSMFMIWEFMRHLTPQMSGGKSLFISCLAIEPISIQLTPMMLCCVSYVTFVDRLKWDKAYAWNLNTDMGETGILLISLIDLGIITMILVAIELKSPDTQSERM